MRFRCRLGQLVPAALSLLCAACPDDIRAFRPDGGASDVASDDLDIVEQGDVPAQPPRIDRGQEALYTFVEGEGVTVRDRDEGSSIENLVIADPANVEWIPGGGLRMLAPTRLATRDPAAQLSETLVESNEITVEVWIEPAAAAAAGPARIVTLAGDGEALNFLLGHGSSVPAARDEYRARIRTSETSAEAFPGLSTPRGVAEAALTHLVLTRTAGGTQRLYVNGEVVAEDRVTGDFSSWSDDYALSLANDPDGGDGFVGVFRLVAIFRRALAADEVAQNYAAGLE